MMTTLKRKKQKDFFEERGKVLRGAAGSVAQVVEERQEWSFQGVSRGALGHLTTFVGGRC